MALYPVTAVQDTLLEFFDEQRPVYETIIDKYWSGRILNLFLDDRTNFPASSLPALAVVARDETLGWHACRVQEEKPNLQIVLTTDNGKPEQSARGEARLITLTTRILTCPLHLRPIIKGTRVHMYDSLPTNVTYGQVGQGRMRKATITWSGKQIEYLYNRLFDPALQIMGVAEPSTDPEM